MERAELEHLKEYCTEHESLPVRVTCSLSIVLAATEKLGVGWQNLESNRGQGRGHGRGGKQKEDNGREEFAKDNVGRANIVGPNVIEKLHLRPTAVREPQECAILSTSMQPSSGMQCQPDRRNAALVNPFSIVSSKHGIATTAEENAKPVNKNISKLTMLNHVLC